MYTQVAILRGKHDGKPLDFGGNYPSSDTSNEYTQGKLSLSGDVGICWNTIWVYNVCRGLTNQSRWHCAKPRRRGTNLLWASMAHTSCTPLRPGCQCCCSMLHQIPGFAVAIRETSSWWLPARTMLMSCSLLPENDSLVRLLAASLKLIQSPPLQGPETSVQNGGPFQGLGLGQDLSTRINDDHHFLCSPIYIDHFGADTLSVTCTYLIV